MIKNESGNFKKVCLFYSKVQKNNFYMNENELHEFMKLMSKPLSNRCLDYMSRIATEHALL